MNVSNKPIVFECIRINFLLMNTAFCFWEIISVNLLDQRHLRPIKQRVNPTSLREIQNSKFKILLILLFLV